jgi:hypothetical protein
MASPNIIKVCRVLALSPAGFSTRAVSASMPGRDEWIGVRFRRFPDCLHFEDVSLFNAGH